jgi:hypothetical protein
MYGLAFLGLVDTQPEPPGLCTAVPYQEATARRYKKSCQWKSVANCTAHMQWQNITNNPTYNLSKQVKNRVFFSQSFKQLCYFNFFINRTIATSAITAIYSFFIIE